MTDSNLDGDNRDSGTPLNPKVSELEQLFDDPSFDTDLPTAAELLGVGRTRLSQIASSGQLPYIRRKVGERYRVFYRRTDIERRVAERYRHAFSALPKHLQEEAMPPRSGASALNTPVQSPALNSSAASAKDTRQFSNSDHEPRLRIRPTLRTRRPLISMTEQIRFEQVMDSLSELTERAHEAQAAHSHLIERSQNLQGTYAKQQAAIDRLNRVHETITAEHLHLRGQVATILEKLERLTETLTRPQREAKKRKHQRRLCESSGNFRRKTSSQRQCRAKK